MDTRTLIACTTADLLGNGISSRVALTGVSEGIFWRGIHLEIENGQSGESTSVTFPEDGYNPRMFLGNFTGEPGLQLLVTVDSGGSGAFTYDMVYAYRDGVLVTVFDCQAYSDSFSYRITYQDGYRVWAESLQNGLQYWIDISGRDQGYLAGVYQADGCLIKPITGDVNPVSGLYPIDFDGDGTFELMAQQRITGLYNADGLGYFQNTLKWADGEFQLAFQQVAVFGTESPM